jgi:UDP-glucose 4-epimerase
VEREHFARRDLPRSLRRESGPIRRDSLRRVLVTGGAGFIGSHLVERLLSSGYDVTVLDNLATGRREYVPADAILVEGDVEDRALVDEVFAGERFDAVFHVAGQASISRSFTAPEVDLGTNVLGTLNVLRGCVDSGVRRLVNASSMTIYGEPEQVPTAENAACIPVSYYGVTKYAAERYVQITGERPDVDLAVTSLRMFNVFGERQSISNPYQGVLAIFIGNVLRGEPLTIHGDGKQTRDFVYIGDVVDAWLRVLDEPEAFGATFNVGSGRETSVNELADAVLASFSESRASWDVRSAGAQLGDQRRSAADTRAMSAIGWAPTTSLVDGVARTVTWARAAGR